MMEGIEQQQQHLPPPPSQPISFLKVFVTQSDWTGTVTRETWYGHHYPWSRVFVFAVLSSWAFCVTSYRTLLLFGGGMDVLPIPILHSTNPKSIQQIRNSHTQCWSSLCEEIGRRVPVDCVVNDDGKSARLEYNSREEKDRFPITETCHDAMEQTLGYRYFDKDEELGMKAIDLINIVLPKENTQQQQSRQPDTNTTTTTTPTTTSSSSNNPIFYLLPDCTVKISSTLVSPEEMEATMNMLMKDELPMADPSLYVSFDVSSSSPSMELPLMTVFPFQYPGYREKNVLKNLFCKEEYPPEIRNDLLPLLEVLYDYLFRYRHAIVKGCLFLYSFAWSCYTLTWCRLQMILPTILVRRFFPSSLSPWDIWRTLVVLSFISHECNQSILFSIVLTVGALVYQDVTAAVEWAFLGILSWAGPDMIYPFLDSLLFVGSDLFLQENPPWFVSLIQTAANFLLVGDGWWKFVTLYVLVRSYQALSNSTTTTTSNNANQFHANNPQQHLKDD